MSQNLEFGYGNSVGNDSVLAGLRTWVRTKKGFGIDATYHLGRPKDPDSFFAVLWQIKKSKPTQPTKQDWRRTVRLLVESPRSEENQFLNSIKRKLIRALINAGLPRLVRDKGYRYDDSRVRMSDTHIRDSITTTLFKIQLNTQQVKPTLEETIAAVNRDLGTRVDSVFQQFIDDLDQHFGSGQKPLPTQIRVVRQKPQTTGTPLTKTNGKQVQYEALVKVRKACHVCSGLTNGSVIEDGIYDCNEIGAWSLWQGNLNAEVMVVGQDWGDVDWFLRVEGYPTSDSPTNTNLVQLLRAAGINIRLANQTPDRGLVFLTNAVLCMKNGGASAPIKPEWLRNCGTRFLRPTIELVNPKVVICLGAKPYGAVMAAYGMIARPLTDAVESGEPEILPSGVYVFPVYHCGAQGVNFNRKLPQQIQDWKRIGNFLSNRRNRTNRVPERRERDLGMIH